MRSRKATPPWRNTRARNRERGNSGSERCSYISFPFTVSTRRRRGPVYLPAEAGSSQSRYGTCNEKRNPRRHSPDENGLQRASNRCRAGEAPFDISEETQGYERNSH
jgi:hypothetical protein